MWDIAHCLQIPHPMGAEHAALNRTWCVQISAFCVSVCTLHLNAERAILGHTHCTDHHRMRPHVHPVAGSDSPWPSVVGQPHWRCVCGTYWSHYWQFQEKTLESRSLKSQKWSDCRSRSERPFGLLKWLPNLLVLPCLLAPCSAKKEKKRTQEAPTQGGRVKTSIQCTSNT